MDALRNLLRICIVFGFIIATCICTKYPNDIEDSPTIECNDGTVRIAIKTSNGVASRIFAKGHYTNPGCVFERTNSATFGIGACGMNRQRQLQPRGITYSVVVVVQLHPLFVTKVDRAYNVKCFYMEAEKTVTSLLDVSMLSTQTVTNGVPMPVCVYELHAESPTGPSARYSRVGDMVWHTWSCPSASFGMLVHSCVVTDGEGNEFKILDEKGCGIDQYVLRTPEYSQDLTKVQRETHVFKFADKTALVFNCQIKLCAKLQDGCKGISPPTCAGTNGTEGNDTFPGGNFTTTSPDQLENETTTIEGGNGSEVGGLSTSQQPININASESGTVGENITFSSNYSTEVNTSGGIIANRTIPAVNTTQQTEIATGGGEGEETTESPSLNATTPEPEELNSTLTASNETDGENALNQTTASSLAHSPGPGGQIEPNDRNATDSVIEESLQSSTTPAITTPDLRGRRNALNSIEDLMREQARNLLEAASRQEDAESIPTQHERHGGGGRLLLDAVAIDGDNSADGIETDVSQSMWVLEPEEGQAGDDNPDKPNHHRHHPLNSLFPTNPDEEDDDDQELQSIGDPDYPNTNKRIAHIQRKRIPLSDGVCLSTKVLWAILAPLILILVASISALIVCLLRARRRGEQSSGYVGQLFPFAQVYKD